jgi:hypothetical protein
LFGFPRFENSRPVIRKKIVFFFEFATFTFFFFCLNIDFIVILKFIDDSVASDTNEGPPRADSSDEKLPATSTTNNGNSAELSQELADKLERLAEEDKPQRVFDENGKPLGMFPKTQATTMCVDVVSVYSPPTVNTSEFMKEKEEDDDDDSSSVTSTQSDLASLDQQNNEDDYDEKNDGIEMSEEREEGDDEPFEASDMVKNSELLVIGEEQDNGEQQQQQQQQKQQLNLLERRKMKNQQLEIGAVDSKSSSATVTPLSKSFSPDMMSAATPKAAGLINDESKSPAPSTTSSSSASAKRTATNKKQSSLSMLTQLSDDLMSDVATKARNFSVQQTNKLISNLLSDEVREGGGGGESGGGLLSMIPSSLSSLNISRYVLFCKLFLFICLKKDYICYTVLLILGFFHTN